MFVNAKIGDVPVVYFIVEKHCTLEAFFSGKQGVERKALAVSRLL